MPLLEHARFVTTALNLPGPAACARLRDWGARVTKVEPPSGDPLERYAPQAYARLHDGIDIRRLDLKTEAGATTLSALLKDCDVVITAQRPAALERLGLAPAAL